MALKMKSPVSSKTLLKIKNDFVVKTGPFFRRKGDLKWKTTDRPMLLSAAVSSEKSQQFFRRASDLKNCSELSDSDLIKVIHTQNKEAYRELFARYQKKLFTYIFHLVGNRDETEDILQNVFSKTFKNIEHFDTSRKFSSWIYRIAHNEAVNYLKRRSKRYTVSWDDVSTSKDKLDTATNEELPEDKFGHQEIKAEIDGALNLLPKKYQQVLKLRYFQEYSYDTISGILNKPVNTVGTLINRAKKKLLEVVQKNSKQGR
jgi:RNA polymerase sigma-70 factor (ECF subfamily)